MEQILNNPGLQHIAEKIFDNLVYEYLEICQGINQSSKQILDYQMEKPMFLLKKFRNLSKVNQEAWIELIESEKNSNKKKAIISYLKWNLENGVLVDLSINSSPLLKRLAQRNKITLG